MKKLHKRLEKAKGEIKNKIKERRFAFDNALENWQESSRGEMYEEKSEQLEEALAHLEDAIDSLDDFNDNQKSN